jgi:hypothetical protein
MAVRFGNFELRDENRLYDAPIQLLSACRQLRHQALPAFHSLCRFEFGFYGLEDLKRSDLDLASAPWNVIRSICLASEEVDFWCMIGTTAAPDYTCMLPALRHIQLAYPFPRYKLSRLANQETLEISQNVFGRPDLDLHMD